MLSGELQRTEKDARNCNPDVTARAGPSVYRGQDPRKGPSRVPSRADPPSPSHGSPVSYGALWSGVSRVGLRFCGPDSLSLSADGVGQGAQRVWRHFFGPLAAWSKILIKYPSSRTTALASTSRETPIKITCLIVANSFPVEVFFRRSDNILRLTSSERYVSERFCISRLVSAARAQGDGDFLHTVEGRYASVLEVCKGSLAVL
jgi:hypothetical protein